MANARITAGKSGRGKLGFIKLDQVRPRRHHVYDTTNVVQHNFHVARILPCVAAQFGMLDSWLAVAPPAPPAPVPAMAAAAAWTSGCVASWSARLPIVRCR